MQPTRPGEATLRSPAGVTGTDQAEALGFECEWRESDAFGSCTTSGFWPAQRRCRGTRRGRPSTRGNAARSVAQACSTSDTSYRAPAWPSGGAARSMSCRPSFGRGRETAGFGGRLPRPRPIVRPDRRRWRRARGRPVRMAGLAQAGIVYGAVHTASYVTVWTSVPACTPPYRARLSLNHSGAVSPPPSPPATLAPSTSGT